MSHRFLLLLLPLLAACGQSDELRLTGEIEGINEDDALLLSTDGGLDRIDTLHICQGEFDYRTPLAADATFRIVYSNQSTLLLWAHPGDHITLRGQAENLRDIKVEGNEENKLYTRLRHTINSLTQTDSITDVARAFVREHASSAVALEVYRQYFAHTAEADSILRLIVREQPDNPDALALSRALRQRRALAPGRTLPPFTLTDTKGRRHTLKDYRGRYLALVVWASWQSTSPAAFFHLREVLRGGTRDTLEVLSLSLDTDRRLLRAAQSDDDPWPTCAPLKGWDTPYVKQLGLRTIPYTILVSPRGKIIAAGTDYGRDVRAEVEKLRK